MGRDPERIAYQVRRLAYHVAGHGVAALALGGAVLAARVAADGVGGEIGYDTLRLPGRRGTEAWGRWGLVTTAAGGVAQDLLAYIEQGSALPAPDRVIQGLAQKQISGRRPLCLFDQALATLLEQHGGKREQVSVGQLLQALPAPSNARTSYLLSWALAGGSSVVLDLPGGELDLEEKVATVPLSDVPLEKIRRLLEGAEQAAGEVLVNHWGSVQRLAQRLQEQAGTPIRRGAINRLVGDSISRRSQRLPTPTWLWVRPARPEPIPLDELHLLRHDEPPRTRRWR
jgi:hypothetical protein